MRPLLMLVLSIFCVVSSIGCAPTSAAGSAAAAGEALSVVREVRERVCDPVVDLLVGPLQSRPCHCPMPTSGGAAPAAPSAPATPAPAPVPTVAPSPPATTPTAPAKGSARRS